MRIQVLLGTLNAIELMRLDLPFEGASKSGTVLKKAIGGTALMYGCRIKFWSSIRTPLLFVVSHDPRRVEAYATGLQDLSTPAARMWTLLLGILLTALASLAASTARPCLDPNDVPVVIRKSTETMKTYWDAEPDYDYRETDLQSRGGTKTFQELMILGSRYERLIAINGKPLSREEDAKEQSKLDAAITARRSESPEERTQRVAGEQKDRQRNFALIQQIPLAFDFSFEGEQQLAGREVYVFKATPKSHYRPINRETQVLKGMQGRLWVDKETFNWVKVEAECIHPVSIVGYLARVEPGTRFELEMLPGSDGVWMPSHYAMRALAKVFFVFNRESSQEESYDDYHKAAKYQMPSLSVASIEDRSTTLDPSTPE